MEALSFSPLVSWQRVLSGPHNGHPPQLGSAELFPQVFSLPDSLFSFLRVLPLLGSQGRLAMPPLNDLRGVPEIFFYVLISSPSAENNF